MFKRQDTFILNEEKKVCVISNNLDNEVVKSFFEVLGLVKEDLENDIEVVNTLGKLSMKKVVIVKEDKVLEKDKLSKLFDFKEELLVLVDTFSDVKLLFEVLVDSSYRFLDFKSKDKKVACGLSYYSSKDIEKEVNEGLVYGEAINNTKELVNKPYNYLNAIDLARYALEFKRFENVEVTVYDKAQIEAMKMGAFLGVNKGSLDEPRLIHIRYRGDEDSKEIISLIGKGVMYDTGGYSLKTTTGMPNMKCDMAGSATVLGAMEVIARLRFKKNVDVVIAATDNRIGDGAIVPDDILTAANGMTIEIISTDAEGRLTLADALWFAQQKGATKLVDIATLTGAIVAALGKEFTGVFTNNQDYLNDLISVSEKAKEKLWQMPISEGYRKELKSFSADMRNTGTSRTAGASVAAAFLEKFVEDNRPWIHLDIAATAFDEKKGGSGVMVKTLAEFCK
jgi:leucyl aminopeptidase